MNCPECNKEIDDRGIVYHFQRSHNYYYPEMIAALFGKIDELEKRLKEAELTISKKWYMASTER